MKITVNTASQAWEKAREFFTDEYVKDIESSERAGYTTYRSTKEYYNYICDLGNRLEINLKQGNKTINIWIEPTEEQKEIAELKAKVAELENKLAWTPFEFKENVQQSEYDNLLMQRDTRFLSDEEAKELLYDWFGFAKEKVKIIYQIDKYETNAAGNKNRKVGFTVRRPAYNATDWNYIRFDCGCMSYELYNDNLRFFVH